MMRWPRVNGLYKTELIRRRGPWRHAEHVELATLTYVHWFNNRRLHSELGDIAPAELEDHYDARTRTHHQVPHHPDLMQNTGRFINVDGGRTACQPRERQDSRHGTGNVLSRSEVARAGPMRAQPRLPRLQLNDGRREIVPEKSLASRQPDN